MEELEYKIWFSKIEIENNIKLKILKDFGTCKKVWNTKKEGLLEKFYKPELVVKVFDDKYKKGLINEANYIQENKIRLINFYEDDFPKSLLNIYNCPTQIYALGNIEKLYEDNIAIVGSRNATMYGKEIAKNIGRDFAILNINVVSGLAIGIDKYAHLGALDVGTGNTIAVLGSGLSKSAFYPYENIKVYERILKENGLIISEYPVFEKSKPYYFPARNRIISGISNKIIVVEAKEKSGSLITAQLALEQGKDVFAVPGNINQVNSIGTNQLIRDGAIPYLSIKDCFI